MLSLTICLQIIHWFTAGVFGYWFVNLDKKAMASVAVPFARDNLPGLVITIT